MKSDFCIGSEWLYYKIYTGVKTADVILKEKIKPVISYLQKEKRIQKWFFIRYKDNDNHIRLRLLVENKDNLSYVINAFYEVWEILMQEDLIWKIQADTYKREIERYGGRTMIESEFIFWQDSEMILKYLQIKDSFSNDDIFLLFSFYSIDSFLNCFNMLNSEKLFLMNELQLAYKKEFEIDKIQKKKMDKKFRIINPQIEKFLLGSIEDAFPEIYNIVNNKSEQIKNISPKIISKIDISMNSFLASHIHMMINRQFTSQQRIYELIIYDHLFRYYRTQNYKELILCKKP